MPQNETKPYGAHITVTSGRKRRLLRKEPMVNGLITKLVELLSRERDLYREILELSKKKQDVVASGNIEELDEVVKKEQLLLVRLGDLERKRKGAIEEIAAAISKAPDDLVLSDLLPHCSAEQKAEIETVQSELQETLREQIELNEINHKLINSKLQYINFTIDMMSGGQATNNYGASGKEQGKDGRSINIIDHKA
ncbi:flagellar protein FlgN [Oscillospiraceae bacterium OttesenSCG-928-G22]|nr:flagellar protein FlgN [Oscillospiraceae bacterium OttesenSCG-928-G22]